MSTSLKTATKKTPLRDLWKVIFQLHIHCIPVIDSKKNVIGIIAEEDLIKPLYPNYVEYVEDFVSVSNFEDMEEKIHDLIGLRAENIMNSKVIFTRPDTPILRALSRMIVRNVRQLPVISEDGSLIGMVSKGDIFDSLFQTHLTQKESSSDKKPVLHHTRSRIKQKKSPKARKK